MKVLFNATTLVMGGALQVSAAFIKQSLVDPVGINWHYAISGQVFNELTEDEKGKIGLYATVFDTSPAKSKYYRDKLKTLQQEQSVDVVFTLFGPAYVSFSVPHVCGVADGWVTHSSLLAFKSLTSLSSVFRMLGTIVYKAIWYRKANAWIVEARNAKLGLIRRLRISSDSVHVISNTCSQYYFIKETEAQAIDKGDKVRILCMSAYYEHKNLILIPEVARYLRYMDNNLAFEFVITLPVECDGYKNIVKKAKSLGVENNLCNIGAVRVSDGPAIYESCHLVFLPSLLETFSANYPEAMASKRPIVTTDLDFARDACKDAALYFEPTNAKSAADKLLQIIHEPNTLEKLISREKVVLEKMSTPEQRYHQFIEIIKAQL